MSITFYSDDALWRAFKLGRRDALDALFRLYYIPLLHYGLKIYAHKDFIEESLQTFFLYLFDHRNDLSEPHNLKAYLFKAYRRQLLRSLEQQRIRERKDRVHRSQLIDIQFSIDEFLIHEEEEKIRASELTRMINSLSKSQREVIYLRFYAGLNIKDIAVLQSVTYQGVVNTIHKAIKALRNNPGLKRISATK